MYYKVFSDYNLDTLISSVSSYIQKGWKIAGGISMVLIQVDKKDEMVKDGRPMILYAQSVYNDKVV